MNNTKKTIALALALILAALAVFAGCTSGNGPGSGTRGTITQDTDEERLYPDLPDVTFNGAEVKFAEFEIAGWGLIFDLTAEADDDNRVSKAIYNRNQKIMAQYDFNLTTDLLELNKIRAVYEETAMTGDSEYDVFFVRGHEMQFILPAGLCLDLFQLPECDFTKPWWDANSVEQFSVGGKLYLAESDITLRDKNGTACLFFNKQVQEDRQIGDIYSLVQTNEWTWDKMIQLAKKATFENGDSVWDEYDNYGLIADDDLTYMMLHAGGGRYATKDENDLPVPGFTDKHTLEVAQSVIDLIFNEEYFFHLQRRKNNGLDGDGVAHDMFTSDQALFYIDALFRGQGFNDMNSDFGIMPIPKYDETQKDYGHSVSIHFSNTLSVPKTNMQLERTSVILEALAAESKYTVIPEFYDVYVKTRNTRDEDAKAMLDLIFSTRVYDLGEFFQFGAFNSVFLRIRTNRAGRNITTVYQRFSSKVDQAIEKFINEVVDKQ
ncbi:MAG: extracellular solute-binding protein [Clostridia bacterium]|nr:extracellular solute-binding protein [Clostridia bacterium]